MERDGGSEVEGYINKTKPKRIIIIQYIPICNFFIKLYVDINYRISANMKNIVRLLLLAFFYISTINPIYCQTDCVVLKPEISLNYQGECKNGFAHGKGEGTGIDHYLGEFKKGLPKGKGVYRWNNGDSYDGEWKKGNRHGYGKFTFMIAGKISIMEGKWVNDEFIGLKGLYKIEEIVNVNRYNIHRRGEGGKVTFNLLLGIDPNTNVQNLVMSSTSGKELWEGRMMGYENLSFPVTIMISYITTNRSGGPYNVVFKIIFNEPGVYEVCLYNYLSNPRHSLSPSKIVY